MATNTDRLFAFCICTGLHKHGCRPSLPSQKWRTAQVPFNISTYHPQLLSSAFLFSLSSMDVYARGQFYTLLEAMGLLKHTKLFTYIENGNLQLWAFGELSVSSCVFAKHHLNTCPCRCRKHHFLTALLNLLVVKPSGKNTWYKPYDLTLHYKTKKKYSLQTN